MVNALQMLAKFQTNCWDWKDREFTKRRSWPFLNEGRNPKTLRRKPFRSSLRKVCLWLASRQKCSEIASA